MLIKCWSKLCKRRIYKVTNLVKILFEWEPFSISWIWFFYPWRLIPWPQISLEYISTKHFLIGTKSLSFFRQMNAKLVQVPKICVNVQLFHTINWHNLQQILQFHNYFSSLAFKGSHDSVKYAKVRACASLIKHSITKQFIQHSRLHQIC